MPGIIDTMILELGLDQSKWTAGQKAAVESLRKTEDQAVRSARNIEEQGKRASEFFARLREQVIGLYAAFTAGREIKEFIRDITGADAAMGYLAKRLDMTPSELSSWGGAMRGLGGTAEDAEAVFQALTSDFQQLSITGNSQFLPYFRALGIAMSDANGRMRPMTDIMTDLNAVFSKMDPARAAAFGAQMGITPKMMDLLLKVPDQFKKILAEQEKLHHATDADIKAAQDRQRAWDNFLTTAENLGRVVLTILTPAMNAFVEVLTEISEWFNNHPIAIEAAFTAITVLVGLLSAAITKSLIASALDPLIGSFKAIAAIGRWALGVEVAAGAAEAASAVGGIGAGLAALGTGVAILTGIGAAIAAIGAAAYEIYEHWEGIKSFFGFGGNKTVTPVSPSRSTAAPTAASQSDISTLMRLGWSRDQAIGILANIQRESGGNLSEVGDKGAAFGLAQWHPDRQADFAKWAGHDIRQSTRGEQLAFIDYELRHGSRRKAGQALMAATSAQSAAQVVSRLYEAPRDADREAATRASIAAAMAAMPNSAFALAGNGARLGANYDNRSHNITSEVHVGQVVVETNATDAVGIAQDIKPALMRESWVAAINSGPS